jgi:hypothetical protein
MKSLKHVILTSLILCLGGQAFAQDTKFGVRLGLGIPDLQVQDDNIFSTGFASAAGFDGGIFLDYGLTENFSIKFEVAFARKGGIREGLQPIPGSLLDPQLMAITMGETVYATFENTAVFSYLTVPVLAKYEWHLGNRWGVYVNGGFYADFIISPTQETSGTSQLFFDPNGTIPVEVPANPQDPPADWVLVPLPPQDFNTDNDIDDDLSDMDFGAMLGVGASYAINSKHEIIADIRGSYGFIPLQKDRELYGDVHMGSLVFSLGYAYTFGKRNKGKVDQP